MNWNTLVLIYPQSNLSFTWNGVTKQLNTSMSSSQITATRNMLSQLPGAIGEWSGGNATMTMTIVEVPTALGSVTSQGTNGFWVSPTDVASDLDTYAPDGKYDSIFVVWRNENGGSVSVPYNAGWSVGPSSWSNGAGYSQIDTPDNNGPWTEYYPYEIFLHEWTHQTTAYYLGKGYAMPNIDSMASYGYSADPITGSWKTALSDIMQGDVYDSSVSDYVGIPTEAWYEGTPTIPLNNADTVVTSLHLTDSSGTVKTSFKVNEKIYVKTTLKNQGTTKGVSSENATTTHIYSHKPSTVPFNTLSDKNVYLRNGEFGSGSYTTYNSYPGSSTESVYVQNNYWTMSTPGTYTARAFINFNKAVAESNYTNNQRTVQYQITQ